MVNSQGDGICLYCALAIVLGSENSVKLEMCFRYFHTSLMTVGCHRPQRPVLTGMSIVKTCIVEGAMRSMPAELATRNEKLLGAPGMATRSKDATNGAPGLTTTTGSWP